MPPAVRALRGATTLDVDEKNHLFERVIALLDEMFERNALDHDDLISVIITATDDIHSAFPAEAARKFGLGDVPLLCARELDIEGGTPMCVRVLIHLQTDRPRRTSTTSTSRRAQPARRPPGLMAPAAPTTAARPPAHGLGRPPATGPGAVVVGTGLIGGSIGLRLRRNGWHVTGRDADPVWSDKALALGALDAVGDDPRPT